MFFTYKYSTLQTFKKRKKHLMLVNKTIKFNKHFMDRPTCLFSGKKSNTNVGHSLNKRLFKKLGLSGLLPGIKKI